MTNDKWRQPLRLAAATVLFALPVLWLGARAASNAAPGQKKQKNPPKIEQLKGCPDTGGRANPSRVAAPEPTPVPPPYQPVPMTVVPGVTGLVVYNNTNGVALINPRNHTISPIMLNEYDYTIDPETEFPIGAPLGTEGGGRFDAVMTRDGQQALISNFGDNKVFFVDLSSGAPVVSGMARIDIFAEDIAIDPAGEWALVSDGGFEPKIAVLHIPSRSWVPAGEDPDTHLPFSYSMPGAVIDDEEDPEYPGYGRYAYSVDIAADGRTVIATDYHGGMVHVLLFDPASGALSVQQSIRLWKYGTDGSAAFPIQYRVLNSAISPDGRTVLLVNTSRTANEGDLKNPAAIFEGCNIAVLRIDQPGHVVRMPDIILPWEVTGGQSIVFSPDGKKAFYETYNATEYFNNTSAWFRGQEIQVIAITGAGQGHHTGTIHTPSWRSTFQFFGVETMAVTPDGNFLYVTNPAVSESSSSPIIDVIDIRRMRHIKQIGTPTNYPDPLRDYPDPPDPPDPNDPNDYIAWVFPAGITFPAATPNRRPVAVVSVDKPQVILDSSEAATFDGSASHDPEGSPLTYAWSLVSAPAGASPTLTPAGKTAVLAPDIEGTYQVGLVVNDGQLDSAMATASVKAMFYPVYAPAGALLQRLENDFIFYKEYVNRLAWTANPANLGTIAAIRVYRKPKGADDSAYSLLVSLAASATGHDDKGLAADQLFIYHIASVSDRGRESDPVTVGN